MTNKQNCFFISRIILFILYRSEIVLTVNKSCWAEKMSENIAKYEEMLPIPAELIDESQKNIAFVQDSGQAIDLNEQGNIY